MQRRVQTPFGEIEYTFTPKAVKNINIRVLRTGEVTVSAPRHSDPRLSDAFVIKKAEFILRARERLATRETVEEGGVMLFGTPLTVVYEKGKGGAFLEGSTLTLTVRGTTEKACASALEGYLKGRLLSAVDGICRAYFPYFSALGYPYPELRLRKMTSRYGTCHTKKHIITISTALVRSPLPLLEFVVLHELVHFIHPNHSPAFYKELTTLMPDWKMRKKLLNNYSLKF